MAQSLSSAELSPGAGHNGHGKAVFLNYLQRHEDADAALEDAKETVRSLNRVRKNLRKTMKADGIDPDVFDLVLADSKKPGELREAEDRQHRRFLAFLDKPLGFQDGLDFTSADPNLQALNALELQRIEDKGYDAGKAGHPRESNTYTPGTPAHVTWDEAWRRGDADAEVRPGEEKQGRRGRGKAANGHAEPDEAARIAGRQDGLAGVMDRAARYPQGEPGHADYELGRAEGEEERARIMALGEGGAAAEPPAAAESAAAPKRRGRPRKPAPGADATQVH